MSRHLSVCVKALHVLLSMSQRHISAYASIQEVAKPGEFGCWFCRLYVLRDVQITHFTKPLSAISQQHYLLVTGWFQWQTKWFTIKLSLSNCHTWLCQFWKRQSTSLAHGDASAKLSKLLSNVPIANQGFTELNNFCRSRICQSRKKTPSITPGTAINPPQFWLIEVCHAQSKKMNWKCSGHLTSQPQTESWQQLHNAPIQ